MSGAVLDYTVQGTKDFELSSGDFKSLHQKSSSGFIMASFVDEFQMTLKLKTTSAVVHLVQISPINVKTITIELLDKDDNVRELNTCIFHRGEVALVDFKSSQVNKFITSRIRLKILMDQQERGGVGLKYLLVKGNKNEPKGLIQKANVSKKPEFSDARLSPHAVRSKESGAMFAERRKNKEDEEWEHLEKKDRGGGRRQESKEDAQLRKAIELSKKEAERNRQGHAEEQSSQWHPRMEEKPRDYPLVDYQKIKHFFANVNSTWLQAQKRLQIQKGIDPKHRLSSLITIKHFNGKSVCIDVAAPKKALLQKMAEEMGAKILKEVADNCLLVSARNDTEKVAKARKCKNVRIVTPNFIEECKQCDAYLSERDYFLKL